jgi:5-deoxy-glucuronate isomerase
LLIHPRARPGEYGEYIFVTPETAGWNTLSFAARRMARGEVWQEYTLGNEYGLVILGGTCTARSSHGEWSRIGRRPDVFSGMPYALYFPRESEFTIEALSELDIAYGWARAYDDHPAQLITPEQVSVEIRGGGNATRQINGIIPPGFRCESLIAVEVYTPSGNWSSYPPHKHDVHREDAQGNILEARLEEVYFYKSDKPEGYAYQRVYTANGRLDELLIARNNDLVLVPEGYHPVVSAHGYTTYYLNFLAGSAQSLANADDPAYAWVKDTWQDKDRRLPLVTMEMEKK